MKLLSEYYVNFIFGPFFHRADMKKWWLLHAIWCYS